MPKDKKIFKKYDDELSLCNEVFESLQIDDFKYLEFDDNPNNDHGLIQRLLLAAYIKASGYPDALEDYDYQIGKLEEKMSGLKDQADNGDEQAKADYDAAKKDCEDLRFEKFGLMDEVRGSFGKWRDIVITEGDSITEELVSRSEEDIRNIVHELSTATNRLPEYAEDALEHFDNLRKNVDYLIGEYKGPDYINLGFSRDDKINNLQNVLYAARSRELDEEGIEGEERDTALKEYADFLTSGSSYSIVNHMSDTPYMNRVNFINGITNGDEAIKDVVQKAFDKYKVSKYLDERLGAFYGEPQKSDFNDSLTGNEGLYKRAVMYNLLKNEPDFSVPNALNNVQKDMVLSRIREQVNRTDEGSLLGYIMSLPESSSDADEDELTRDDVLEMLSNGEMPEEMQAICDQQKMNSIDSLINERYLSDVKPVFSSDPAVAANQKAALYTLLVNRMPVNLDAQKKAEFSQNAAEFVTGNDNYSLESAVGISGDKSIASALMSPEYAEDRKLEADIADAFFRREYVNELDKKLAPYLDQAGVKLDIEDDPKTNLALAKRAAVYAQLKDVPGFDELSQAEKSRLAGDAIRRANEPGANSIAENIMQLPQDDQFMIIGELSDPKKPLPDSAKLLIENYNINHAKELIGEIFPAEPPVQFHEDRDLFEAAVLYGLIKDIPEGPERERLCRECADYVTSAGSIVDRFGEGEPQDAESLLRSAVNGEESFLNEIQEDMRKFNDRRQLEEAINELYKPEQPLDFGDAYGKDDGLARRAVLYSLIKARPGFAELEPDRKKAAFEEMAAEALSTDEDSLAQKIIAADDEMQRAMMIQDLVGTENVLPGFAQDINYQRDLGRMAGLLEKEYAPGVDLMPFSSDDAVKTFQQTALHSMIGTIPDQENVNKQEAADDFARFITEDGPFSFTSVYGGLHESEQQDLLRKFYDHDKKTLEDFLKAKSVSDHVHTLDKEIEQLIGPDAAPEYNDETSEPEIAVAKRAMVRALAAANPAVAAAAESRKKLEEAQAEKERLQEELEEAEEKLANAKDEDKEALENEKNAKQEELDKVSSGIDALNNEIEAGYKQAEGVAYNAQMLFDHEDENNLVNKFMSKDPAEREQLIRQLETSGEKLPEAFEKDFYDSVAEINIANVDKDLDYLYDREVSYSEDPHTMEIQKMALAHLLRNVPQGSDPDEYKKQCADYIENMEGPYSVGKYLAGKSSKEYQQFYRDLAAAKPGAVNVAVFGLHKQQAKDYLENELRELTGEDVNLEFGDDLANNNANTKRFMLIGLMEAGLAKAAADNEGAELDAEEKKQIYRDQLEKYAPFMSSAKADALAEKYEKLSPEQQSAVWNAYEDGEHKEFTEEEISANPFLKEFADTKDLIDERYDALGFVGSIDDYLPELYDPKVQPAYSSDENEALVQKAVLYTLIKDIPKDDYDRDAKIKEQVDFVTSTGNFSLHEALIAKSDDDLRNFVADVVREDKKALEAVEKYRERGERAKALDEELAKLSANGNAPEFSDNPESDKGIIQREVMKALIKAEPGFDDLPEEKKAGLFEKYHAYACSDDDLSITGKILDSKQEDREKLLAELRDNPGKLPAFASELKEGFDARERGKEILSDLENNLEKYFDSSSEVKFSNSADIRRVQQASLYALVNANPRYANTPSMLKPLVDFACTRSPYGPTRTIAELPAEKRDEVLADLMNPKSAAFREMNGRLSRFRKANSLDRGLARLYNAEELDEPVLFTDEPDSNLGIAQRAALKAMIRSTPDFDKLDPEEKNRVVSDCAKQVISDDSPIVAAIMSSEAADQIRMIDELDAAKGKLPEFAQKAREEYLKNAAAAKPEEKKEEAPESTAAENGDPEKKAPENPENKEVEKKEEEKKEPVEQEKVTEKLSGKLAAQDSKVNEIPARLTYIFSEKGFENGQAGVNPATASEVIGRFGEFFDKKTVERYYDKYVSDEIKEVGGDKTHAVAFEFMKKLGSATDEELDALKEAVEDSMGGDDRPVIGTDKDGNDVLGSPNQFRGVTNADLNREDTKIALRGVNALNTCLGVLKSRIDSSSLEFRTAAELSVQIRDQLQSDRYSDLVRFSEEDMRVIETSKAVTDLHNRLEAAGKKIDDTIAELQNKNPDLKITPEVLTTDAGNELKGHIMEYMAVKNLISQRDAAVKDYRLSQGEARAEGIDGFTTGRRMLSEEEIIIDPQKREAAIERIKKNLNENDVLSEVAGCETLDEMLKTVSKSEFEGVLPVADHPGMLQNLEDNYIGARLARVRRTIPKTEENAEIRQALNNLSCVNRIPMLRGGTDFDRSYAKRAEEYQGILDLLEEKYPDGIMVDIPKTAGSDETQTVDLAGYIRQDLNAQMKRLKDAESYVREELREKRERLIDNYFDKAFSQANRRKEDMVISDRFGNTLHYEDIREKIVRGEEVSIDIFGDAASVGREHKVKLSSDSSKLITDSPKVVSRIVNLADFRKGANEAERFKNTNTQLESLYNTLQASNPFYVKNSKQFNDVLKSLGNVIEARKSMGSNANVKRVDTLQKLYADLDSKLDLYAKMKSDKMKKFEERGDIRYSVVKSLQSITGKDAVRKMCSEDFRQERSMLYEYKAIDKPVNAMKKYMNFDHAAATPEEREKFANTFKKAVKFYKDLSAKHGNIPYAKMASAQALGRMAQIARSMQMQKGKEGYPAIDTADLKYVNNFVKDARKAREDFKRVPAAIGSIKLPGKEKVTQAEMFEDLDPVREQAARLSQAREAAKLKQETKPVSKPGENKPKAEEKKEEGMVI